MKIMQLIAMLALGIAVNVAHGDILLHGFTFNDDAFADSLIAPVDTSGFVIQNAPSVEEAVTGHNTNSFAFNLATDSFITVGFVDNVIVNGPGDDLIVFELNAAAPDPIVATINGIQSAPTAQTDTGDTTTGGVLGVSFTAWDLSDFGVATGGQISSVMLQGICEKPAADRLGCTEGSLVAAAFAAIGAFNSESVPEPTTLLLLGLGLAGLGFARKRLH